MMILNPMDDQVYEAAQKEIGYAKLFPYILEDFVTREDIAMMMKPSNLPVSTSVNTILAGAAPSGPVTGTGIGSGNGVTSPVYICKQPAPASIALKATKVGVVNSGGAVTSIAIGSL